MLEEDILNFLRIQVRKNEAIAQHPREFSWFNKEWKILKCINYQWKGKSGEGNIFGKQVGKGISVLDLVSE